MIEQLKAFGNVETDRSFKQLTTLKVGGNVKIFFEPIDIRSLVLGLEIIKKHQLPYKIIGFGSNILCSDNDYNGVVIKLSNLNHFEINDNELYTEAGTPIITIANFAINNGLSGLQFATGIPAMVGGTIFMNASAYNEGISDVISEVLVYKNHSLKWIAAKDLEFAYRNSIFQRKKDWIIVAATFNLKPDSISRLKKISVDRNTRRWQTQPIKYPNCGSIFRNLENYQIWKLVDDLKLRGKIIGQAQISEKHSNFIVNLGNCQAKDINTLIDLICEKAKSEKNIDLKLEVEKFNW
ncbi:MAG: UDP-N-acetylmuramate dehydrogenase [Erysipelothrix sp.]|nr:UDP-N-acetylmuramate dehydrogenase [Erysipelothrix sp.]